MTDDKPRIQTKEENEPASQFWTPRYARVSDQHPENGKTWYPKDTSLEIHTVTGKKIEKTSIVYGLEVSSVNANENPVNISLPKVYSRQTLPVTVDEIPTLEKLSNWPYLKDVCQHLPSVTDGEI